MRARACLSGGVRVVAGTRGMVVLGWWRRILLCSSMNKGGRGLIAGCCRILRPRGGGRLRRRWLLHGSGFLRVGPRFAGLLPFHLVLAVREGVFDVDSFLAGAGRVAVVVVGGGMWAGGARREAGRLLEGLHASGGHRSWVSTTVQSISLAGEPEKRAGTRRHRVEGRVQDGGCRA